VFSSSHSASCSKSISLSFLILLFPKNLGLGNNKTVLKSFMKEVPVEHKLEQFSFGSLRRRQELWKLLSSLHLCRSPAPSWPGKQSQLCLLAAGSPGEAHRCLLSAPYLKTWSSSPLGRRQSRWQGGCLRTYAETLKRAVWKVPACWEVGNWLGLLSFFFCAEKEGFELFYDQSWFKER